jgi:hypothetical protein
MAKVEKKSLTVTLLMIALLTPYECYLMKILHLYLPHGATLQELESRVAFALMPGMLNQFFYRSRSDSIKQ